MDRIPLRLDPHRDDRERLRPIYDDAAEFAQPNERILTEATLVP
jgi:hypothetical protein